MSSKNVLKMMKDKEIEFVDLRFTDPKGKLQHLTMDTTIVDEEMFEDGVFFEILQTAAAPFVHCTQARDRGRHFLMTLPLQFVQQGLIYPLWPSQQEGSRPRAANYGEPHAALWFCIKAARVADRYRVCPSGLEQGH